MAAYYNENDPFAAEWLRRLILARVIADGEVDERSIADVSAVDVRGFDQCHWFAGIGGWSLALRLAGWPDDRRVWSGSCPCQPFSGAGRGQGAADARHLWPFWYRLIGECRPRVVFGEQVESAIGHGWLDLVCDDLEREGYACGPVSLSAACVGAFHIRQRIWFVADKLGYPERTRLEGFAGDVDDGDESGWHAAASGRSTPEAGAPGIVADPGRQRCEGERLRIRPETPGWNAAGLSEVAGRGEARELADPDESGHGPATGHQGLPVGDGPHLGVPDRDRESFWGACDWIACSDGKARPVEPGSFPLAHGVSGRMAVDLPREQATPENPQHWYSRTGALRGFGNAIVPEVAAAVIAAYMSLDR